MTVTRDIVILVLINDILVMIEISDIVKITHDIVVVVSVLSSPKRKVDLGKSRGCIYGAQAVEGPRRPCFLCLNRGPDSKGP